MSRKVTQKVALSSNIKEVSECKSWLLFFRKRLRKEIMKFLVSIFAIELNEFADDAMNTTPTSTTDDTLPHHGSCDDFCNFSDRRAIQDIPVESVLLQENVALATWTHRMVGSMIQTTRNQESRRVISEKKRRIKRSLFSSESTTPSQESCHLLVSLSRHPSTSTFIWLLI